MRILRRTVTLRIAAVGTADRRPFEGLLLLATAKAPERIRGHTLFVRTLPDCDATIVVAPTEADARLEVAYDVTRRNRSVMSARSWWPIALLERRRGRVIAAGLDGPFGDDAAGVSAALRAV